MMKHTEHRALIIVVTILLICGVLLFAQHLLFSFVGTTEAFGSASAMPEISNGSSKDEKRSFMQHLERFLESNRQYGRCAPNATLFRVLKRTLDPLSESASAVSNPKIHVSHEDETSWKGWKKPMIDFRGRALDVSLSELFLSAAGRSGFRARDLSQDNKKHTKELRERFYFKLYQEQLLSRLLKKWSELQLPNRLPGSLINRYNLAHANLRAVYPIYGSSAIADVAGRVARLSSDRCE